jgi:exopolysaccharide biosynthesis polyprenyl glycosylphosphotransferase
MEVPPLLFNIFPKTRDIRASITNQINIKAQTILRCMRVVFLILLDGTMLSLAWIAAKELGTPIPWFHLFPEDGQYYGLLLPILVISLGIFIISGFYGTDDRVRSFPKLIKVITQIHLILLTLAFLHQPGVWISRSIFLLAWLFSLIFVGSERFLIHLLIIAMRNYYKILRQSVILIGTKEDIERVHKLLQKSQKFKILATADSSVFNDSVACNSLLQRIEQMKIDEVIICSWQSIKEPIILFWQLKSAGVKLRIIPPGFAIPKQWSEIKMIDQLTTIRFNSPPIVGIEFLLKRIGDFIFSLLFLLLLSLPLIVIAVAIVIDSPGPVFFRQIRVGLKGREFKMWKFRTMVKNASELQKQLESQNEIKGGLLFKLKEDPRITKVGKFLRRYSLDEIPQLFNVLLGEMSLVGPRPLPLRDVEKFSEKHHFLRHEILPGITGLWQVRGRSNVDSDEVFSLDLAYIKHWSLALDCQILFETVKVVFTREGAY